MYETKSLDAALVVELDRLAVGALVDELDVQALREERGLAQALRERVARRCRAPRRSPSRAGTRSSCRCPRRSPTTSIVALRVAARELLAVDLAVAAHLGDEPLGERVDDGDADAVQAAGDLVAVAAELAAGVELREDDRQRRLALALDMMSTGMPRAPVADRHRVVGVEGHLDAVVAARESLVDRVVDDLVDEVVEAPEARRADVHARAQPDGLEALENGDVFCGVGRLQP